MSDGRTDKFTQSLCKLLRSPAFILKNTMKKEMIFIIILKDQDEAQAQAPFTTFPLKFKNIYRFILEILNSFPDCLIHNIILYEIMYPPTNSHLLNYHSFVCLVILSLLLLYVTIIIKFHFLFAYVPCVCHVRCS